MAKEKLKKLKKMTTKERIKELNKKREEIKALQKEVQKQIDPLRQKIEEYRDQRFELMDQINKILIEEKYG